MLASLPKLIAMTEVVMTEVARTKTTAVAVD